MTKIQEIKFYFAGWNFKLLAVLFLVLAIFIAYAFNVPTGKEERLRAKVVSLGMTHSSKYSASHSSARVRLSDGAYVDITLPRDAILQKGDEIVIKKKNLLFRGSFYKFDHAAKNP